MGLVIKSITSEKVDEFLDTVTRVKEQPKESSAVVSRNLILLDKSAIETFEKKIRVIYF